MPQVRHTPALISFALLVSFAACQNKADTTGVVESPLTEEPLPGEPNTPSQETNPNAPAASSNTVVVAPAAPGADTLLVGRMGPADGNGVILSWPASRVVGGFTGTSIAAKLAPTDQGTYPGLGKVDNYIDVAIDGKYTSTLRVPQGTTQLTLASQLAAGTHSVAFTKRTETQMGSLTFSGFVYGAGGAAAPAPALPARKIEFVGDSGLVGYGADANVDYQNMCSFSPATENASASFALVAADALSAQAHLIGYSGKGLYHNRDQVNDAYNTLPVLWTVTSADGKLDLPDWQPSLWVADAVVVVVGGNDFATTDSTGDTVYAAPSASAFGSKANTFMKTLRAAYPKAWLFVTTSPMLDADIRSAAESYAKTMVASVGDGNAAFVALPYDDGSRNYGCDYHMNVATHRVVGQALAKAISAKTGW